MDGFIVRSLLSIMLLTGMAWADVYRCVSDDGTVRFSDRPCSGDPELFIKEEGCHIDDSIRRAKPFTDLTVQSENFNDRLVSHARKLGKCILPDETYVSYRVSEDRFRDQYHTWVVRVNYENKGRKNKWRLTFTYDLQSKNGTKRICMSAIIVQLNRSFHDLPSLENIASLNQLSTGKYEVR